MIEILLDDSIRLFHRLSVAELVASEGKRVPKKHRLELYDSMVHVFHTFPVFSFRDEAFARVALWMTGLLGSFHSPTDETSCNDGSAVNIAIQEQEAVLSVDSDGTTCTTLASSAFLNNDGGDKETKHFFSLFSIVKESGKDCVKEENINLDTMEKVTRGFS